jgi:perosamine synthetase
MKVSVNECTLNKSDIKNVTKTLKRGWYSSAGPIVPEFENLWAQYCNRQFGVAVTSGTTGLISAMFALELKKYDEVIVPNFTIISCGLAIQLTGAKMVPVDCDMETFNVDVNKLKLNINENTKAIVVVHIYGQPANMDEIKKIAFEHDLMIIEDAAEAHGAEYQTEINNKKTWMRCGSEGDMSVFSFYSNKLISTGEGGMVITNSQLYAEKLEKIRNLGFSFDRSYQHQDFGFQFRMTSMQAALGIPQISRMDKILAKKREIYFQYKEGLSDLTALNFPEQKEWARSCHWVTSALVNKDYGLAGKLRKKLQEFQIETRPFFVGMHQQPIYKQEKFYHSELYQNSEFISAQGIILPSGLATSKKQIDYVIYKLRQILN